MANGIYIGMSGAIAAQRRLDIVANNVANANTGGFRQQRAQFQSYMVKTNDQRPVEKGFVAMSNVYTDTQAGAIQQTGNPLDLAIEGPGYFAVRGPDGNPMYTRAGNFRVDAQGTLVDHTGNAVLAGPGTSGGTITLRPEGGQPSVGIDGSVAQDGTVVATVSLVDVDPTKMQRIGDTHFSAAPADVRPASGSSVHAGALETSNVNPVRGLVELVQLTQDFQTAHKVMAEYRRLDQRLLGSK
jgi:flagellar basal-body rod protein FlgF